MLRNSFVFLKGIGKKTEQKLWDTGIRTWDDFLIQRTVPGISDTKKQMYDEALQIARDAYETKQWSYFARVLPQSQLWRLFPECDDVAYLDIETTGLSVSSTITVVGIYRNGKTTSLVSGQNLCSTAIKDSLEGAQMIVTFNGSLFDLPLINHHYPRALPDIPHMDLRFVAKQAGYSGGLKKIEVELGLSRPDDIVGVSGYEAVLLWHRWRRSADKDALDKLLRYNAEDVINLPQVADKVIDVLKGRYDL